MKIIGEKRNYNITEKKKEKYLSLISADVSFSHVNIYRDSFMIDQSNLMII